MSVLTQEEVDRQNAEIAREQLTVYEKQKLLSWCKYIEAAAKAQNTFRDATLQAHEFRVEAKIKAVLDDARQWIREYKA